VKLLTRSSLRYLDGHRWQFGLSIVGIALGVAVVVSVDLANASAARAFELSSDAVTGRATHQVTAGSGGLPQQVFVRLRTDLGIRRVAPVVEGYVSLPGGDGAAGFATGRPLRLLGIDPFSEGPFRTALGTGPLQIDLGPFLTRPGAVLLSAGTAASLGVDPGDALRVRAAGRPTELYVSGVRAERSERDEEATADLLIADIATAQEVLDMAGRLSRIDLIFDETPQGNAARMRVEDALPAGAHLVTAAARTETTRQMTRAFRLNLAALSLLALVCGAFLVYNTMSFSVVQRRQMIGTLRALGVTRAEVFTLVLGEALTVGIVGTILGLLGGVAMGRALIDLVTQTINDLYFVVAVRDLALDPVSLAKGIALGLFGAGLAALPAAFEATSAPPRAVLMRSQMEARARRRALPAAGAGVALLLAGFALLAFSGRDLPLSFAALFLTILGFALLTPAAVVAGMRLSTPPMGMLLGPLGRIATRGVTASLSRTAVAIAALMIAVSVVVGVGVMIDSFRSTVTRWLGNVLVADLYVAPPAPGAKPVAFALDAATRAEIEEISGVQRLSTLRRVDLPAADGGRLRLLVFDIDTRGESGFQFTSGDPARIWREFRHDDAVIVTEPYAYRHRVEVGDTITLATDSGDRPFRVAGVYYNYASEEGLVAIDRTTYERHWNDRAISGFSVYLESGVDVDSVATRIRRAMGDREVVVQSNRALRETSLEVFDRTFLITGVLRLLVTLVAVIGVLSALMSLQLERAQEIGVLRALGMTPHEVWRLSTAQSGLMGVVSGLLAIPVGLCLAGIMIFVINRRSFGWTLEMEAAPSILLQAFLLALVASLAAGLYPARRMSMTRPAAALREE
jgi:putative ABC transport system permease protein